MKFQKGVTALELVLTITLMAIVGAIATVKFAPTTNTLSAQQMATRIAGDIRHAQMLAFHWGCSLRFDTTAIAYQIVSNVAYTGKPCSTQNAVVIDPATRTAFNFTLENGAQFSANYSLIFDSTGRPISGGAISSAAYTINVVANGKTYVISVSAITGLVTLTV